MRKPEYRFAASLYTKMPVVELEFALPLSVQKEERQKMPCPCCDIERFETVTYRQELYRFDSFGDGNRKRRTYEISFRETLIEAHKYLDDNGLKKRED
jgi:hypothetical protein